MSEDRQAQKILFGQPAENEETSVGPRLPDVLIDYIRVQVCDLQRIFKTQPCIFSELPWIDAEPL